MIKVRHRYKQQDHPWNHEDKWSLQWKWFEALGYERVGEGSRANVFVHPSRPDVAVKVGRYDMGKRKDAWLTYVMNAAHWGDKKVPKVYSVTMYKSFYVAVMERLYPVGYGKYERTWRSIENQRTSFAKRLNELTKEYPLRFDLSCSVNNMLRRKNGEVVVTDPLYCPGDHRKWS